MAEQARPRGLSPEVRAKNAMISAAVEQRVREHQRPAWDYLEAYIVQQIRVAESEVRADERVESDKTIRMIRADFKMRLAHGRIQAGNEALRECANDDAAYAASCSDDVMADAWRSSAHRHLIKLMLSEAPPVEPNEEQLERERMMDAKVIPDDRFPDISEREGT